MNLKQCDCPIEPTPGVVKDCPGKVVGLADVVFEDQTVRKDAPLCREHGEMFRRCSPTFTLVNVRKVRDGKIVSAVKGERLEGAFPVPWFEQVGEPKARHQSSGSSLASPQLQRQQVEAVQGDEQQHPTRGNQSAFDL